MKKEGTFSLLSLLDYTCLRKVIVVAVKAFTGGKRELLPKRLHIVIIDRNRHSMNNCRDEELA